MNYKYGMRLRGFSLGCQPKDGFVECLNGNICNGKAYWDIIVYSRKLTDEEVQNFDLDYLGEA